MNLLSNSAAFIFALGVIIFFHELGHLIAAKAFNVRVLTFSLGFGKRLFGFQRGETDYRVALFPLGGYVQLGGEDPSEVSDDPCEFSNKPRWQRIVVYLAGPAMNAVLSVVLIAVVFMMGLEMAALRDVPPVVGVVAEAGRGKSRLCDEFVERCRARGIRVNAAHCPAHGKAVPYLPLLELLRDIFGIGDRDTAFEAR